MTEIPPQLKPAELPDVEPALGTLAMPFKPSKSISRVFDKLGIKKVGPEWLRKFREMGIEIDPAATVRDARAGALVTQQCLIQALGDAMKQHEKAGAKKKLEIAGVISMIAGKLNTTNKNMHDAATKELPRSVQSTNVAPKTFIPMQLVVNVDGQPKKEQSILITPQEEVKT